MIFVMAGVWVVLGWTGLGWLNYSLYRCSPRAYEIYERMGQGRRLLRLGRAAVLGPLFWIGALRFAPKMRSVFLGARFS